MSSSFFPLYLIAIAYLKFKHILIILKCGKIEFSYFLSVKFSFAMVGVSTSVVLKVDIEVI